MDLLLSTIKPNLVQSIRAFSVDDLHAAAQALGHNFLYANLANAQTKTDILDTLVEQFKLSNQPHKNTDGLLESLTNVLHRSTISPEKVDKEKASVASSHPGFVVVLEHIPANSKFDKEARENLLDTFREISDYWAEKKVAFRCFYSFSVARTALSSNAASIADATSIAELSIGEIVRVDDLNEKMPTDKLVDISPMALRMSSPFNMGYWLSEEN